MGTEVEQQKHPEPSASAAREGTDIPSGFASSRLFSKNTEGGTGQLIKHVAQNKTVFLLCIYRISEFLLKIKCLAAIHKKLDSA